MIEEFFIYDDKFSKAERIGRKFWYDFITAEMEGDIEYLYFTPTKYDRVDGYMKLKSYDKPITFEIKRRNINSETYKEEGYILEKTKYNALNPILETDNYGWYINIFDDCIKIWDVSTLSPTFEIKYCTNTTVEDYKKGSTPKLVHLITEEEEPIYTIKI